MIPCACVIALLCINASLLFRTNILSIASPFQGTHRKLIISGPAAKVKKARAHVEKVTYWLTSQEAKTKTLVPVDKRKWVLEQY